MFGFHWVGGTATDVATGRTVQTNTCAYYRLLRLSNNSTIFVAPQGISGDHIAAPHDGGTGDSGSSTWVPALEWQFFTQF